MATLLDGAFVNPFEELEYKKINLLRSADYFAFMGKTMSETDKLTVSITDERVLTYVRQQYDRKGVFAKSVLTYTNPCGIVETYYFDYSEFTETNCCQIDIALVNDLTLIQGKLTIEYTVPQGTAWDVLNSISQLVFNRPLANSDFLKNYTLKTEDNFNNINTTITLSFKNIFDNLNKIFCLKLDIQNTFIQLLSRDMVNYNKKYSIDESNIFSFVRSPNITQLTNKVTVGYKTFKSSNATADAIEEHGAMVYSTPYQTEQNALDLTSDFIASKALLANIPKPSTTTTNPQPNETPSMSSNIFIIGNNLTPYDNLQRWAGFLGINETLTFASADCYSANAPKTLTLNGGFKEYVKISATGCNLCMIDEIVQVTYCGKTINVYLAKKEISDRTLNIEGWIV